MSISSDRIALHKQNFSMNKLRECSQVRLVTRRGLCTMRPPPWRLPESILTSARGSLPIEADRTFSVHGEYQLEEVTGRREEIKVGPGK